jgi:hypothetical protein
VGNPHPDASLSSKPHNKSSEMLVMTVNDVVRPVFVQDAFEVASVGHRSMWMKTLDDFGAEATGLAVMPTWLGGVG